MSRTDAAAGWFSGVRSYLPKGVQERMTLSPINRRRWTNFKANRRGYWSLIIFLALFVLSLFAEFIAND
ncbi:MAG: ABC transporter permease, partial [Alphaproteobacteria bacterium]|nr:ABC transporter permease [Alphaproteobacteria bacterium]